VQVQEEESGQRMTCCILNAHVRRRVARYVNCPACRAMHQGGKPWNATYLGAWQPYCSMLQAKEQERLGLVG
jgi:hypothetical protein